MEEQSEPEETFDGAARATWERSSIELMGLMSRMKIDDVLILLAEKSVESVLGLRSGVRIGRLGLSRYRAVAILPVGPKGSRDAIAGRGNPRELDRLGWHRSMAYDRSLRGPYFWIEMRGRTPQVAIAMKVTEVLETVYQVPLPWLVQLDRVAMRNEARLWSEVIGREQFRLPDWDARGMRRPAYQAKWVARRRERLRGEQLPLFSGEQFDPTTPTLWD